MANAWYRKGAENLLNGNIVYLTDTIYAVFVDASDYTPNLSTDNALDDIPAGARVGTPQALASKTVTNGFFDAADLVFPSVSGDPSEYVAFYKGGVSEATSYLLWLFDTATGLTVIPNSGNITITFNVLGIVSI